MSRTPNYAIITGITVNTGKHGTKMLPAGSLVRLVEPRNLPKHVLEKHKDVNPDFYVFIFTYYGFIVTERYNVREI